MVLLCAVLLPGIGVSVNGAQSWIGTGIFQFQPAEIAKLALVLYGAHLLATQPKRIKSLSGLMPLLVVAGGILGLIVIQPDLGTTLVATIGLGCLLLIAGVQPRTLLPVAAGVGLVVILMLAINPYQLERVTSFMNPSADPGGAGFQSIQSSIALGSGGVFGVGLGESVQKAFYLPEAHTDMIAAVIGEEAGLAGMFVLIALFAMYGYAGFRAAHRARDRYGKLLAAGLTSMVLVQASINLFAVLGLAPLTGVPLPFVSYGGTSLVVMLAATGLILNVARRPAGASSGSKRTSGSSRGRAVGSTGAGKLRMLDGGSETRRRRAGTGTSGDSGRRHGGSRRSGARRRRRAAG
jgi:cell division protein FtsW